MRRRVGRGGRGGAGAGDGLAPRGAVLAGEGGGGGAAGAGGHARAGGVGANAAWLAVGDVAGGVIAGRAWGSKEAMVVMLLWEVTTGDRNWEKKGGKMAQLTSPHDPLTQSSPQHGTPPARLRSSTLTGL